MGRVGKVNSYYSFASYAVAYETELMEKCYGYAECAIYHIKWSWDLLFLSIATKPKNYESGYGMATFPYQVNRRL